jgi:hypothetical protein
MIQPKEWFIKNKNNKEEGPYSLEQLKKMSWLTPFTFVKHTSWKEWEMAGNVEVLEEIFLYPTKGNEEEQGDDLEFLEEGKDVLALPSEPKGNFWLLFLIILSFLLVYYWGRIF